MRRYTKRQTYQKILDELTTIAFANGADYSDLSLDENGNTVCVPVIPPDKKSAIAQVRQGRYGVEITTHDKYKAIEILRALYEFDKVSRDKEVKIIDDI